MNIKTNNARHVQENAAVEATDAVDSYANSDVVDADSKLFRIENGSGYSE